MSRLLRIILNGQMSKYFTSEGVQMTHSIEYHGMKCPKCKEMINSIDIPKAVAAAKQHNPQEPSDDEDKLAITAATCPHCGKVFKVKPDKFSKAPTFPY
jgi:phage FluMu protein Com